MNPTDEELDREWQPSGRRPQSTIARSFSQELMDIFRIENSVADLDEQVDKRKQNITTQSTELEAIEARIREMEDRLRRSQQTPARRPQPPTPLARQRRPVPREDPPPAHAEDTPTEKARSRPGTARERDHVPGGAMPPTPVASEDGDGDHGEQD